MLIRNILVPTDFSPHAEVAIERAAELARQLSAKLHLLHAYQLGVQVGFPEQVIVPPDFADSVRAGAQTQLERIEKRLAHSGVVCDSHLSALPAVSAIVELAEYLPADLIVMGTRGLSGIKHLLLGSVAERTVRLASTPVMTVRSELH